MVVSMIMLELMAHWTCYCDVWPALCNQYRQSEYTTTSVGLKTSHCYQLCQVSLSIAMLKRFLHLKLDEIGVYAACGFQQTENGELRQYGAFSEHCATLRIRYSLWLFDGTFKVIKKIRQLIK